VFDHCLYYGRVKTQDKKVRESIETYIYELGGGLHAGVKGLDPFSLGCGVYGCYHISANVKSDLDDVGIVPQRLYNTRVLMWLFTQKLSGSCGTK
jgi:hypothetical protein